MWLRSQVAPVGSADVSCGLTAFSSMMLVKGWSKMAIRVGVTGVGLPAVVLKSMVRVYWLTTWMSFGLCSPLAWRSPAPGVDQIRSRLHLTSSAVMTSLVP